MIRQIELNEDNIGALRHVADALGSLEKDSKERVIKVSTSKTSITLKLTDVQILVATVRKALLSEGDASDRELSPQDAAEQLRVSRPTVMRLIEVGKLGARKVGAHYRLSEAEVLRFKAEQGTVRRQNLEDMSAFSQDFDQ